MCDFVAPPRERRFCSSRFGFEVDTVIDCSTKIEDRDDRATLRRGQEQEGKIETCLAHLIATSSSARPAASRRAARAKAARERRQILRAPVDRARARR